MDIKRVGTQPCGKGPCEWFPGTVRTDPLLSIHYCRRPIRRSCKPQALRWNRGEDGMGTRTRWGRRSSSRPVVAALSGKADPSRRSGPGRRLVPARQKHSHGESPTSMTHIAIQEKRDGKVDGLEHASDEQYRAER
jgi:hypothetical protein